MREQKANNYMRSSRSRFKIWGKYEHLRETSHNKMITFTDDHEDELLSVCMFVSRFRPLKGTDHVTFCKNIQIC